MSEAVNSGTGASFGRRFCERHRLTNVAVTILACGLFAGCFSSEPSSKQERIKQIKSMVAKAGGEEAIQKESQVLFSRDKVKDWKAPGVRRSDKCLEGLPGIQSLGDVFRYEGGRIEIRVYNSHQDTYFICLLNPELPRPENFDGIVGTVGFLP